MVGEKSPSMMKSLVQRMSTCNLLGKEEIIGLIMEIYMRQGFAIERDREELLYVVS